MTRVVERAFDVLEFLAGANDGVHLSELSQELEMSPATVHRLLRTMVGRGYADQDRKTRRYGPGPKLLEVAARATTSRYLDLRRVAMPYLRQLAAETGETGNLILPFGADEIVYVEQSRSPRTVGIFTQVGHRAPLYCTAAGKAILAHFSPAELEGYLARTTLVPVTEHTLATPEDLVGELADVRRRGFAVDDEERESGVRCAAAPILNHIGGCVGALSVSGLSTRLDLGRILEDLGPGVRQQAVRCSVRLGYSVPTGGFDTTDDAVLFRGLMRTGKN